MDMSECMDRWENERERIGDGEERGGRENAPDGGGGGSLLLPGIFVKKRYPKKATTPISTIPKVIMSAFFIVILYQMKLFLAGMCSCSALQNLHTGPPGR